MQIKTSYVHIKIKIICSFYRQSKQSMPDIFALHNRFITLILHIRLDELEKAMESGGKGNFFFRFSKPFSSNAIFESWDPKAGDLEWMLSFGYRARPVSPDWFVDIWKEEVQWLWESVQEMQES